MKTSPVTLRTILRKINELPADEREMMLNAPIAVMQDDDPAEFLGNDDSVKHLAIDESADISNIISGPLPTTFKYGAPIVVSESLKWYFHWDIVSTKGQPTIMLFL